MVAHVFCETAAQRLLHFHCLKEPPLEKATVGGDDRPPTTVGGDDGTANVGIGDGDDGRGEGCKCGGG